MIFIILFLFVSCYISFKIFSPIYQAKNLTISYGIHPFDICEKNPELWKYIKFSFIITYIFSNIILINLIFNFIFLIYSKFKKFLYLNSKKDFIFATNKKEKISLLIGYDEITNTDVYLPESGLYQNFLITGTIGSGKTSSAMHPFTEQFIKYNSNHIYNKIGMLILDVKGNYYEQVKKFSKKYLIEDDLIVIELNSNITYNPLHKPNLKPQVLANRLRQILELFSENQSESYWLDKAEQIISECIKLCRLYNDGYVTFEEIHKLITQDNYYKEKIEYLRTLFISAKFNKKQVYELNTAIEFFQKEFFSLDSRTSAILKSEITLITNVFVSDYDILKAFCPRKENLTFTGFKEAILEGKIVVLNMNISEYKNLSKIIAAYLKLDFQTEIMTNLSKNEVKTTAFICDEYAEYVTKSDSNFFSLSREAKCINIVSTQSYSSLKNTLKDESSVKVITQNLINKIWFRTDDILTIEEAQKQLGKEEKIKTSTSISENARETNFSYISNSLNSQNSSLSESFNTYSQLDYVYDTNFFTQSLETFTTLAFLSTGTSILKPRKLKMYPYFLTKKNNYKKSKF